jgi:putative membrane protein
MKLAKLATTLMTVLAAAAMGGCESDSLTTGPAIGAAMSEPQIAGVMVEDNTAEMTMGQLALARSADVMVRSFATRMVVEHSAAGERVRALASALGVQPADSDVRQRLASDGYAESNRLWAAAPTSFDVTYLQGQVDMHTAVLNLLDLQMIPSAQTPAMRTELTATRSTVALHLMDAQTLLAARRK